MARVVLQFKIEIGFNFNCPRLDLNVSGDFSFKVTKKFGLHTAKDSFIYLDQDILKVVKIFGQVESTV